MPKHGLTSAIAAVVVTTVATGAGLASNFSDTPTKFQLVSAVVSLLAAVGLVVRAERVAALLKNTATATSRNSLADPKKIF